MQKSGASDIARSTSARVLGSGTTRSPIVVIELGAEKSICSPNAAIAVEVQRFTDHQHLVRCHLNVSADRSPRKLPFAACVNCRHSAGQSRLVAVSLKGVLAERRPMSADGRPPQATNGSFVYAEREGSWPVVGQLRSTSMGWYGSKPALEPRPILPLAEVALPPLRSPDVHQVHLPRGGRHRAALARWRRRCLAWR